MKNIIKIVAALCIVCGLSGCTKSNDLPPIYELEYATVSEIIGNEIRLKIGNPIEQEQSGEQKDPEPIPSDESAVMGEAQESEGLQLIYTGEEEQFVIGSGIEIMSMGENGSLKDIKKGSIVQFQRDENNKIIRITVM